MKGVTIEDARSEVDLEPAQLHAYARYCELVGELCLMVPPVAPPPTVIERLLGSFGDLAFN